MAYFSAAVGSERQRTKSCYVGRNGHPENAILRKSSLAQKIFPQAFLIWSKFDAPIFYPTQLPLPNRGSPKHAKREIAQSSDIDLRQFCSMIDFDLGEHNFRARSLHEGMHQELIFSAAVLEEPVLTILI